MAKIYAETAVAEERMPSGGLTITKVIREHIPLYVRKGYGETIGSQIDAAIAQAVAQGDEIQEVTVGFDPEQWRLMTLG